MLSTASQRMRYAQPGTYTIPQPGSEYLSLPGQHSPLSSPPHPQAAAGGAPQPMPMPMPMTVPQLYLPSMPSPCGPDPSSQQQQQQQQQQQFALDPAFLLSDLALPLLSYDCLLTGADDDRVYYVPDTAGSPTLSSSPTSPSSAGSGDSSNYSPGGLTPVMSDQDDFERSPGPGTQAITPPQLPPFMSRPPHQQQQQQQQQQQAYALHLPEQAYYAYPAYPAHPPQQMHAMPLPAQAMQYPQVYPMGMQYSYACVDPTALAGPAPAPQQQQQQQAQQAEQPQPPRRDRRTQRQRQPDYVPRPPNPFICFRQDWLRRLQRGEVDYTGPRDQRTMSFRISADWREMPESAKAQFRREALRRKREHAAKYPGYKFAPRQKDREGLEDDC